MKLVTYEPAPGCDRLGALIVDNVVDLALAREVCVEDAHVDILVLPSDMSCYGKDIQNLPIPKGTPIDSRGVPLF